MLILNRMTPLTPLLLLQYLLNRIRFLSILCRFTRVFMDCRFLSISNKIALEFMKSSFQVNWILLSGNIGGLDLQSHESLKDETTINLHRSKPDDDWLWFNLCATRAAAGGSHRYFWIVRFNIGGTIFVSEYLSKKPAFSSDMSGGAILRDFSKMAISRDLGRVRRRAYTHFQAEIRGFLVIWVSSPNSL